MIFCLKKTKADKQIRKKLITICFCSCIFTGLDLTSGDGSCHSINSESLKHLVIWLKDLTNLAKLALPFCVSTPLFLLMPMRARGPSMNLYFPAPPGLSTPQKPRWRPPHPYSEPSGPFSCPFWGHDHSHSETFILHPEATR